MNPQKLMKQLQQKQERVQQEIAALEIEASSGGGMVTVVMDGHKGLKSLRIDPEVVSKDDVDMLQDLVLAAVNEVMWRGFPTDTWIASKMFLSFPLTLVFAFLQIPLLKRYWDGDDNPFASGK